MKIKSTSLISFVSILSCVSAANAGVLADFYIGGTAGIGGQAMFADHTTKNESARTFGAVIGMDIPIFRIEAEYNYFTAENFDTNAGMLNLYAKMPSTIIQPYIGAGIGMVFDGEQKFTKNDIKDHHNINSATAYQAMLGTTIGILAIPLKFDIEGRALYAPDIYTVDASGTTPDMLQYNVRVKARYIF